MQTPVFLILFLAPVYVPLALLKGWIHAVASVNPATALLDAGRGLISGGPGDVALGFACAAGLVDRLRHVGRAGPAQRRARRLVLGAPRPRAGPAPAS